jgi:Holliday junction resolvase-like predicted endonuclease
LQQGNNGHRLQNIAKIFLQKKNRLQNIAKIFLQKKPDCKILDVTALTSAAKLSARAQSTPAFTITHRQSLIDSADLVSIK